MTNNILDTINPNATPIGIASYAIAFIWMLAKPMTTSDQAIEIANSPRTPLDINSKGGAEYAQAINIPIIPRGIRCHVVCEHK
ncbi:hypothetical protein PKF022_08230 [Polynucleobacter sp. KF022]|nr:hypothetical protein PKF022_08230 [Polynucleobacter sp. KF022]